MPASRPPSLRISLATTRTAGADGRPWPRLTAALPAARPGWGGREGGGHLHRRRGGRARRGGGGGVVTPPHPPAGREWRGRFPRAAELDAFVASLDPPAPP